MNYMSTWIEELDNRITMADVLNLYTSSGHKPSGRCSCPLHQGKDKNFSYSDKFFQCWVCGAKGNAVTFVAQLFGIGNKEAIFKIDKDFNLGITGKKPKASAVLKAKRRAKAKAEEERKRKELNDEYIWATSMMHDYKDLYRNAVKYGLDDIAKVAQIEQKNFEVRSDMLLERILND